MTIQQHLSHDIEPLAPTDTIGHAVYRFADLDVKHLPVVDEEERLVALVAGAELLELPMQNAALGTVVGLGAISLRPDAHVFEAANLLAIHNLSLMPVVEAGGTYLGFVRRSLLFEHFATMLSTGRVGAIVVLEVPTRDYSLSHLSHLVEQSGGRVLSSTAQSPYEAVGNDSPFLRVTLKLNATDTSRLRYLLEHHGYRIVAVFGEEGTEDELTLRVQEFMRYLEV